MTIKQARPKYIASIDVQYIFKYLGNVFLCIECGRSIGLSVLERPGHGFHEHHDRFAPSASRETRAHIIPTRRRPMYEVDT